MTANDLQVRGRSLEEAFFTQENERLRLGLRASATSDPASGAELGIDDAAVFDRLKTMDVTGDTVAALTLIPVVAIAWADGELHARERDALLKAAEAAGIAPDSPSHKLLETWFRERPDPELFERWKSFIVALCADMPVASVEALRSELLHRARAVAESAGGLLGFGKVSGREREILNELEHAFPA